MNDLMREVVDPLTISCVVLDEAHKVSGNHAYAQIIDYLNAANAQYRLLALSATPCTNPIQLQVINNIKRTRY